LTEKFAGKPIKTKRGLLVRASFGWGKKSETSGWGTGCSCKTGFPLAGEIARSTDPGGFKNHPNPQDPELFFNTLQKGLSSPITDG